MAEIPELGIRKERARGSSPAMRDVLVPGACIFPAVSEKDN